MAPIKVVWVGDLDGDEEYDFVLDRTNTQQSIEAYSFNGTFLWDMQYVPSPASQSNIEPGSTAFSVGNWDNENNEEEWGGILDGRTEALQGTSPTPTDYIAHGPLAARFVIRCLDMVRPHLVAFTKYRQAGGDFNRVIGAWTFDGGEVSKEWISMGDDLARFDGHHTRVLADNGDRKDDFEIGLVLNGEDRSLLYTMTSPVVHGGPVLHWKDRTRAREIAGVCDSAGQQELLIGYYYDARDGSMQWQYNGAEIVGLAERGYPDLWLGWC
ncbi:hypothetical protein BDV10DRAFT_190129 [Aspergillus recurvatus]